jgi:hypothetical protein
MSWVGPKIMVSLFKGQSVVDSPMIESLTFKECGVETTRVISEFVQMGECAQ